jgi:hypothetical protein
MALLESSDNLLERIVDLQHQATTEHDHFYTAKVLGDARARIETLELYLKWLTKVVETEAPQIILKHGVLHHNIKEALNQ